ncbi:MAG: SUMF1/EgtB/PvdO family nonheme iron enzyme [Chloroflexota bacterium]
MNWLPDPFAWCDIPTGDVRNISDDGQSTYKEIPAFRIAKYPITNHQYQQFKDDDGYNKRRFWTFNGWADIKEDGYEHGYFWRHYGEANKPVVSVSWYEANAYTRWLSEKLGFEVFLPSDEQWRRAASGDDHWVFPFGNDWDASKCNNNFMGPYEGYTTTDVTTFEGIADSPFGVVDMAGNVNEWTSTKVTKRWGYTEPPHEYDIRCLGGSWRDRDPLRYCVPYSGGLFETYGSGDNDIGFRIATSA